MNFLTIMNQVLIVFLMIIVGFIAAKKSYITREVRRGMVEILMNLAIPGLVIVSFDADLPASVLADAGIVLLFALVSHALAAVLGFFLFRRYPESTRRVLIFAATFSNCAFMGYPIMESIFGPVGIFYVSVYTLAFNLYLFSFGQILFTGAKDARVVRKVLFHPGTIAVMIGLVLLLTPLQLPFVVNRVATLVGSLTTPLAMMVIGSMLAEVQLRKMFHGRTVYYSTVLRLLLLPAATFLILRTLGVDLQVTSACMLLIGMPAASNTVIFAEKYGGDAILATRIVVISTAFSVLTIPLMALVV